MIISAYNRNFGLDVARATAACLVLSIHLVGNLFRFDMGPAWYLAYLGVDIFFVLSGFLIGNILIQSIDRSSGNLSLENLKKFYIRRWLRTVPLYYFILALNFFVGYLCFHNTESFNYKFLFWMQNMTNGPPRFFGEAWSLAIEEWFYLVYPLGMILFLACCKRISSYPRILLAYTVLFLVAGNLLRISHYKDMYQEYNVLICRIDAIGYGVLLAVLDKFFLTRFFRRQYRLCGMAGMLLLLASIYIFLAKHPVLPYLLYYPLAGIGISGVLVYLKQERFNVAPVLRRVVSKLSKISYSIYLNNLLVTYLVMAYLPANPFVQLAVALLMVLVVSHLTFYLIELNFMELRDRYFPSRKRGKRMAGKGSGRRKIHLSGSEI